MPRSKPDMQRSGGNDQNRGYTVNDPTPEQLAAWDAYAAARYNRDAERRRRQTGDQ